MKRVKSMVLRTGLVVAAVCLGLPAAASAATVTWMATAPTGLTDLQHQQAYTWRIDNITLDSTQITGATLKFNGFYNWTSATNDPYNILFADLLDTAVYSGIKSGTDNSNPNTLGKYDIDDAFRSPTVTGGTGTNYSAVTAGLITSTTGVTYIGSSYNNNLVSALTATELANAGYVVGQTGKIQGTTTNAGPFGTTAVNWQLDFNATALTALKNYLSGTDNTIAIGLDADCHFYDSSIVLEIYYNQTVTGSAVPEPATLLLVGSGLAAAYRRRRRATRTV